MSGVVVLVPVVVASWPVIASSIVAAAAAAGYRVSKEKKEEKRAEKKAEVELDMENMDVVAESLSADDEIVLEREGVTVRFTRDARGRFRTCVDGNLSKDELRKIGEDLAGRVVQQYVYRKLTEELHNNGFITLDEAKGQDESIRLHVRRHQG